MYTGEKDRIAHINFVMSCIHRSTNQIYEHLIDREYEDLRKEISSFDIFSPSIPRNGMSKAVAKATDRPYDRNIPPAPMDVSEKSMGIFAEVNAAWLRYKLGLRHANTVVLTRAPTDDISKTMMKGNQYSRIAPREEDSIGVGTGCRPGPVRRPGSQVQGGSGTGHAKGRGAPRRTGTVLLYADPGAVGGWNGTQSCWRAICA